MVLAAGTGARLRPLTDDLPKPMVSVNGRPMLDWTLRSLARHGVREVVINTHHRADVITRFCGDGAKWRLHIQYSPEARLQGTAGALRAWRTFFDQTFLVVYGDNLTTCSYPRLVETHRAHRADVTIALFWRPDTSQSGIAEVDSEGWVTRFVEKPRSAQVFSHWANAGVLVLEPALVDTIPADGAPDFGRDLLPRWIDERRRVLGYQMSAAERLWWIDTPRDLARVIGELQDRGVHL